MTDFPDHYAALGIDPTADQEVIAAAYRALAKKYHPDTGATTGTASPQRFAEIQQAYEVLGSPDSRHRYDQALLEATQRELDEHLAAKQRKLAGTVGTPPPPPPPDLGVIRPERRARSRAIREKATLRNLGPFLVLAALLLFVAGGFGYLVLGTTPPLEKPPLPGIATPQQQAEAPPPAPEAQPQKPEETPLFGTSMMDQPAAPPPPVEEALVEEPAPEAAPERAAAPETAPAPIPKVRPAAAPAAAPAKTTAKAPEKAEARAVRYSVVIYERSPDGEMVADRAGVVFASEERCNAFGEDSVLRRLEPYEGLRNRPRIWYECEEAP